MKKATTDERTKRTEADHVEPARTDEDSGRWKQTAVVTTEDEQFSDDNKLYKLSSTGRKTIIYLSSSRRLTQKTQEKTQLTNSTAVDDYPQIYKG